MTLYRLKLYTQKQLRGTRDQMLELEYLVALEESDAATRRKSAIVLSNIQLSDLRLRRKRMDEIRNALKENEDELTSGIEALQNTLQSLSKVREIIDAATSVVDVVAKVVA